MSLTLLQAHGAFFYDYRFIVLKILKFPFLANLNTIRTVYICTLELYNLNKQEEKTWDFLHKEIRQIKQI